MGLRRRGVDLGCRLVGPSLYFCTSFYGESKIIGRAIAPPTLPEPTPMYGTRFQDDGKKTLNPWLVNTNE